jgi:hypothetical protein
MTCLAGCPKKSLRSPVSTVVTSIRSVAAPCGATCGGLSPHFASSSFASRFGGKLPHHIRVGRD